jgi:hypothetical protein
VEEGRDTVFFSGKSEHQLGNPYILTKKN